MVDVAAKQEDFSTTSKHTSLATGVRVNPGIYVGRVENNLDPGRMGQVEVSLFASGKAGSSIPGDKGTVVVAKRTTPFGGQLSAAGLTKTDAYDNNQQSYGLWATPPDVGTFVLVLVTEGGDGEAYYVGFIPDPYMNANMFTNFEAEYNKRARPAVTNDPSSNERQLNEAGPFKGNSSPSAPLYDNRVKLEKVNGLWADPDRGPQTSSPRREIPSNVLGLSSAGPPKYSGPMMNRTAHEEGKMVGERPFSRLGGTNIVMDDGNPGLQRTALAKDGKREYVPAPAGEDTIPHSEQFRIETRTGHKIIMHNSEDFISIIHSNGDSWMEFTANGKIDVYSRGGISMATEKDEKAGINFHAHQLNIDVDELNISAKTSINIEQRSDPDAEPNFALKVKEGKLDILSTTGLDIQNKIHDGSAVTDDMTFKLKHDFEKKSMELAAGEIPSEVSEGDNFAALTYNHDLGKLEINATNYDLINKVTTLTSNSMNSSSGSAPQGPFQFEDMPEMIQELPASFEMLDKEKAKYSDVTETLKTPLRRVPRKQPWKQTENLDPTKYTPEKILYGVEKTEDSEPVYAKNTWHSDTGNANVKVHEDRGGY